MGLVGGLVSAAAAIGKFSNGRNNLITVGAGATAIGLIIQAGLASQTIEEWKDYTGAPTMSHVASGALSTTHFNGAVLIRGGSLTVGDDLVSTGASISQATNDARYVLNQGDTMTGILLISPTGATADTKSLQVKGTASGQNVHAVTQLSSSGTLVAEGNTDIHGVLSGSVVLTATTLSSSGTLSVEGKVTIERYVTFTMYAPATDTATGSGNSQIFRVPPSMSGFVLSTITSDVYTAGTTNTTDVQIKNLTKKTHMLSTVSSIDSGETSSDTAATPAVIDTGNDDISGDDLIVVYVEAVSTIAAKGLVVQAKFIPQ